MSRKREKNRMSNPMKTKLVERLKERRLGWCSFENIKGKVVLVHEKDIEQIITALSTPLPADVDLYVSSLRRKGTAWHDGCADMLESLWRHMNIAIDNNEKRFAEIRELQQQTEQAERDRDQALKALDKADGREWITTDPASGAEAELEATQIHCRTEAARIRRWSD